MTFAYTNTDLIAMVKRRGMIPTSQDTFSNDDFLLIATDIINGHIAPMLVSTREEYYTYPIDRTLVSGTANYLIPTRAMGDGLRGLFWVTDAGDVVKIVVIDLENQDGLNEATLLNGNDFAAYKQGSEVIIKPTPSPAAGSLRFFISIRPGKLVQTTAAGQVTAFNTVAKTVTVGTIPSSWASGNTLDFIQADPHYRYLDVDRSDTAISGTTITFTNDLPTSLAIGDWVALQGESPIPQIPHELMPLLSQWTMKKCLEAIGDRSGAEYAAGELKELQTDAMKLIQPRIKSEAKKVVNRNRLYLLNRTW